MANSLFSTISVMNFNNIRSTRTNARRAYSPSTDFIFNNFPVSKSFTDYINRNTEAQLDDFIEKYEDNSTALSDVSSELRLLYIDMHTNKEVSVDSDTLMAVAKQDALVNSYQIDVTQLATTQIDQSKALVDDNKELLDLNNFDISLAQDEETFDISIKAEATDSNKDIMKKISSAINQSDADVKAKVLSSSDGRSTLSVESVNTGSESEFELSGALTEFIDINTISRSQDAVYTVDGQAFESQTNTVVIDKGNLEITFNEETDGAEDISVSLDTDTVEERLENLSDRLEDITGFFDDYGGDSRILGKYERRLNYLINNNRNALESVGINRNDEGNFSFSAKTFKEQFEVEGETLIEKLDSTGGFIDQLSQFSKDFEAQDIRSLAPSDPESTLPTFNQDDFITYLSFSSQFNIQAFYPTGNILDFRL